MTTQTRKGNAENADAIVAWHLPKSAAWIVTLALSDLGPFLSFSSCFSGLNKPRSIANELVTELGSPLPSVLSMALLLPIPAVLYVPYAPSLALVFGELLNYEPSTQCLPTSILGEFKRRI